MELQPHPPTREYTMESQRVKKSPTIRQRVGDFLRRILRSGTGDISDSGYVWNAIRTAVENDAKMSTHAKSLFLSDYAWVSQVSQHSYIYRQWEVCMYVSRPPPAELSSKSSLYDGKLLSTFY